MQDKYKFFWRTFPPQHPEIKGWDLLGLQHPCDPPSPLGYLQLESQGYNDIIPIVPSLHPSSLLAAFLGTGLNAGGDLVKTTFFIMKSRSEIPVGTAKCLTCNSSNTFHCC